MAAIKLPNESLNLYKVSGKMECFFEKLLQNIFYDANQMSKLLTEKFL